MKAGFISFALTAAVAIGTVDGFTTAPQLANVKHSSKGPLCMSLRPLFDELCQATASKFQLQVTDFSQVYNAQQWQSGSSQGTADWLSEQSPQYLTGCSFCTRYNNDNQQPLEELTINIWMGPSYDVPHLLLTFGQESNAGGYHVTADYVPRGPTVLGGDPQYLEMYYGPDVQTAWLEAYRNMGGVSLAPVAEFETRLLDSPARISVGGIADPQAAAYIVRNYWNRFAGWIDQAQQVPARSRGAFNLRDDKLRQFFFRGQVKKQVGLLGEFGQTVAVVNTGPTAEAYVGGGS